jgi:serine phosphatase RsbU (regulator of sigma subunit)
MQTSLNAAPEITGALLSRILTSMQDLGEAASQMLAAKGVSEISLNEWYPRSIQHECFNETLKRFGESALYAVGFAYQNMVRDRYSNEVTSITDELLKSESDASLHDIEILTENAVKKLVAILHNGSLSNVRNHPESYGFFFEKIASYQYSLSFSSFPITSLTSYSEAIIYGMLRLAFPPSWIISINLDTHKENRINGNASDHFLIRIDFVRNDTSIEEMRLHETLQVKQKLLLAAMNAAQAEHEKASKLLANHLDSVTYASRLQKNLLVPYELLSQRFKEFSVIWEPREIVGGDIYWTTSAKGKKLDHFSLALFDCTGHGVPGAMLSLLATSTIDRIYSNNPEISPDNALMYIDKTLRDTLHQRGSLSEIDDGCDAAIVRIDPIKKNLEFAGAKIGLIKISSIGLSELFNPTPISIGYQDAPIQLPDLKCINYESGDTFVMFTDGFTDQIGSVDQNNFRSYGKKRLIKLLEENVQKSVDDIIKIVKENFDLWQGSQIRRDDLTLMIFRP